MQQLVREDIDGARELLACHWTRRVLRTEQDEHRRVRLVFRLNLECHVGGDRHCNDRDQEYPPAVEPEGQHEIAYDNAGRETDCRAHGLTNPNKVAVIRHEDANAVLRDAVAARCVHGRCRCHLAPGHESVEQRQITGSASRVAKFCGPGLQRFRRKARSHLASRTQCSRHRGRVLRRHQDPVAAARKDLRWPVPAIGRDDRRAASQGFGQCYPEALGARRKHEHVGTPEPWQRVVLEADEIDCVGNPELASKVLEMLTQQASTQDQKAPLPTTLTVDCHRPQQGLMVFLRDQTGCRDVNRRHPVTEPWMDRRHVGAFLKPRANDRIVDRHDFALRHDPPA